MTPNYNKVARTSLKINYENTVWSHYGFISEYMDSKSTAKEASKEDWLQAVDATTANEKIYKEYINK